MARPLPSLSGLLAFEAAARFQSFTRGAASLRLTQTAVSHAIRALEDELGVALFERRARGVALTPEGLRYFTAVERALDALEDATACARRRDGRMTLTVSVVPSFASRWLVPRLGAFRAVAPDIDVRIAPSADLVDFARAGVDVAIRFGRGRYPGLRSDRLMDDEVFPVCSPDLVRRGPKLCAIADLAKHVLLHDETHGDWRAWLAAAGARGVDAQRGPIFLDSSMLVQAAVSGQGVALARRVLAEAELARGALVRPFALSLPTKFAYYVVSPKTESDRPHVRAFREWVLSAAQTTNGAGEIRRRSKRLRG